MAVAHLRPSPLSESPAVLPGSSPCLCLCRWGSRWVGLSTRQGRKSQFSMCCSDSLRRRKTPVGQKGPWGRAASWRDSPVLGWLSPAAARWPGHVPA